MIRSGPRATGSVDSWLMDQQRLEITSDLARKERALRAWLRSAGRVVVAYSGGIDSSLLLEIATDELGSAALGVVALGASLPSQDEHDARRLAAARKLRIEFVATDEFDDPRYLANAGDRCFWCRSALVRALEPIAVRERARMIYGAIVDDLADDRPGMRAAQEGGIEAPLLDAGFTKSDVRALARRRGLEIWAKPASACLSSRVPVGTPIDPARLEQVDRAERALHALGFAQVRVRDHGTKARIELAADDLGTLTSGQRAQVVAAVCAAGFSVAEIDPHGYRPPAKRLPAR